MDEPETPSPAQLALSVLDAASRHVVVLDAGWIIRYSNRAALDAIAGATPASLIGIDFLDCYPALRGSDFQRHVESALAGVAVSFETHDRETDSWMAVTAQPIPEGVVISSTNVSMHKRREEALSAAVAQLDAIIDSSPDLVVAVDRTLTLLAFNRGYAAEFEMLYGRRIQLGETFIEVLEAFPEARDEAVARWQRAAVDGEEFTVQREIGPEGGETRIYEIRYSNLRDATGLLIGAVSALRDVTARVRDQSRLAELTDRLEAVIRYSPDRVVGVDRHLRIVAMNEHARADFLAVWGLRIEVGDSLYDRLSAAPEAQRTTALAMWEAAVAGAGGSQFAYFGSMPDTMQAYEISFGAVRDAHGEPAGAVMVAKDVTDRELALMALRASESRFRALGEASPIGIFLADATGRCTYANPQLQRIWELREAAIVEQGLVSRVHPDDFAIAQDLLGLTGNRDFRGEFRLVMEDGVERRVLGHSAAMRDETGEVRGRVGTVDDITEVRQADEARRQLEQKMLRAQKVESLEVLAGGIAHDFNNLLVGVLGNASLALLDVPPQSPAFAPLRDIERAAQRASDLTRQMLAYSGRGQFIVEPVDLSELVAEMSALLRTVLSRNAVLDFDLATTLSPIEADATQIRQVVMNLLTNASDAVAERGGDIHVRTGFQSVDANVLELSYLGDTLAPGDYVFVEVQDTGDGMDADTLARIFEPFFTTKFTGRGLGLAAALGIVRGHRGGIRITSAPGKGATFRVLLPVSEAARTIGADATGVTHTVASGIVLVIDDDESVRVVTRRLLERRGYRVVVAADGPEGIARFRAAEEPFALVLLDLTMPRMNGAAVMAMLKVTDPEVCVLLTSGYRERDVSAHFDGMAPAGFLQKPFRAEELYAAVAQALSAK